MTAKNLAYGRFVTRQMAEIPAPEPADGKLAPTPPDIEGPFYKAGAPFRDDERLCESPDLCVHGRVLDTDGIPVLGAVLDVWQADKGGNYDNDGYTLRGKVKASGYTGNYRFETIVPGDYQIAEIPPDFRCAHIHVRVTADGFKTLTTQLYFPDDKYNPTDHWFDPRRVIQHPDGCFDFVLEKS